MKNFFKFLIGYSAIFLGLKFAFSSSENEAFTSDGIDIITLIFVLILVIALVYFIGSSLIKYLDRKALLKGAPKEFNELYENLYKNNIQILSKSRNKVLIFNVLVVVVNFIAMIVLITSNILLTILLLTLLLVTSFLYNKYNKEYQILYKNNVIKEFITLLNPNLNYVIDEFYSNLRYKNPQSKLSPVISAYKVAEFDNKMFNLFSIDDTLSGPLSDDCDICMYDISVKNETGSGKNKSIKNIFNGIFLTTNVKINFSTPIKILRNSFNPFGNEKIEMDNSEFENYFDVIGTDKILAMRILTPEVLDTLLNFYNTYGIDFEISLYENTMYLRLFTGQMFEPAVVGDPMDKKSLYTYFFILQFILELTQKINKIINNLEN